MDSTHVAIGLSKMDFSAICHLNLMARPSLQNKKNKKPKKKNPTPPSQNSSNSFFARKHQFYFIQQFCTSFDNKEVKHIDQKPVLFYLRKDASKRLIFLNGRKKSLKKEENPTFITIKTTCFKLFIKSRIIH